MNKVFVSKVNDYDVENLIKVIDNQFSQLGFSVTKGSTVVIKPNLIMKSKPEQAIITHPNVVEAVGVWVLNQGAKVLIVESPGGTYSPSIMKSNFDGCGYTVMAKKHGFELYTACEHEKVICEDALICKSFDIVKPFINADYIIDIAKLKSHGMLTYSGASKNLFGTVPGLMKPELHMRFPKEDDFATMLVDLCLIIKPQISVIDAIDAMEGDGPTGGRPKHIGALISADNTFSADFIACQMANMVPSELSLLKKAMDRGLCPENIDEIKLFGEDFTKFIQKDFLMPKSKPLNFVDYLPKFLRPLAKKISTPVPKIQIKNCIGCGKCAESCPAHTIEIIDKKAIINKENCISCFCCHEMCPKHVIDIKRFTLFNL
ncbi:MAG: DUF362 domain-containing protein [Clostridia bacterium]